MTVLGLESSSQLGTEAGTGRGIEGPGLPSSGWAFEDDFSSGLGNWTIAHARTAAPPENNDAEHVNPGDWANTTTGTVLPPNDVVYNMGGDEMLRIMAGSQNYGDTLLRCARQFDFTGGSGVIEADLIIPPQNFLHGWVEIHVHNRPYAWTASFADNSEGPRAEHGFTLKLNYVQFYVSGAFYPGVRLTWWEDYLESAVDSTGGIVFSTSSLVTARFEFDATDFTSYINDVAWCAGTWDLPTELFDNPAWVYIGVHNHASLKYGPEKASNNSYWGGFRFDGPAVLPVLTACKVADATETHNIPAEGGVGMDIGFSTPTSALTIPAVPAAEAATLLFVGYVSAIANDVDDLEVYYRLNATTWHQVTIPNFQPGDMENATTHTIGGSGVFSISETVDVAELVVGANTVQFRIETTGAGTPSGLTPYVSNIQLLVEAS